MLYSNCKIRRMERIDLVKVVRFDRKRLKDLNNIAQLKLPTTNVTHF